jgi:short-subunit dehydrogenase
MERVLVTGASRGIGAATAAALARPQRHLLLVARTETSLNRVREQVERAGGSASILPCDLARPEQVEQLNHAVGDLDGMVINAGMSNDRRFLASAIEDMDREMQVNYGSPRAMLHHHLPRMVHRGRGRVVTVGSLTSFVPFPGNATYAASKAALFTMVRSLRAELDGSGVTLGVVLPGLTRTEMTRHMTVHAPPMSAEDVGRSVAQCYEEGRPLVIPGLMNRAAAKLFGAFPGFSDRLMVRFSDLLLPGHRG